MENEKGAVAIIYSNYTNILHPYGIAAVLALWTIYTFFILKLSTNRLVSSVIYRVVTVREQCSLFFVTKSTCRHTATQIGGFNANML